MSILVRGISQMKQFSDRVERLTWFGHVQMRDWGIGYVHRGNVLGMELPGRRKEKEAEEIMDVVKEDMEAVGRQREWRGRIRCGDP